MTAPSDVDWPAVADRLAGAVSFTGGDAAAVEWRVLHRSDLLTEAHMSFACRVVALGGGLPDAAALPHHAADWLARTAPVAYAAVRYRPEPVRLPSAPPCGLVLDERLGTVADWPLRGQADTWAAARGRPLVVVLAEDLAPGSRGSTTPYEMVHAGAATTLAAVVRIAGPPAHTWWSEVHETFEHELRHLADSDPARTEQHADDHASELDLELTSREPSPVDLVTARAELLAEFAALPLTDSDAPPGVNVHFAGVGQ